MGRTKDKRMKTYTYSRSKQPKRKEFKKCFANVSIPKQTIKWLRKRAKTSSSPLIKWSIAELKRKTKPKNYKLGLVKRMKEAGAKVRVPGFVKSLQQLASEKLQNL